MIGVYFIAIITDIIRMSIIFHGLLGCPYRKGMLKLILIPLVGVGIMLSTQTFHGLPFYAFNTLFSFLACLFLFKETPYKIFIIYIPVILAAVTWDNLTIALLHFFYPPSMNWQTNTLVMNNNAIFHILLQQSICHTMLIILLSLLWLILKRFGLLYKFSKDKISKTVYFLCLSGFFMTSVIISLLRALSEDAAHSNLTVSYIIMIAFSILINIICFSLIYLFYSREQYKTVNQIREEYSSKQIDYYKALLTQDEDTRKFRHDIKNHILCIQELLDLGKFEDAKEYIREIYEDLSQISSIYDTGNDIVNAIINYYTAKGKADHIKLQVKGYFQPELTLPMLPMCTIVSNLLSNAYEATEQLDRLQDKIITVEILCGTKYFKLITKNPLAEDHIELNNNLQSTKVDKRSHGFGIRNVKAILAQYDGEFTLVKEDKYIIATVIMKVG